LSFVVGIKDERAPTSERNARSTPCSHDFSKMKTLNWSLFAFCVAPRRQFSAFKPTISVWKLLAGSRKERFPVNHAFLKYFRPTYPNSSHTHLEKNVIPGRAQTFVFTESFCGSVSPRIVSTEIGKKRSKFLANGENSCDDGAQRKQKESRESRGSARPASCAE
jgi:hypothetical protein